MMIVQKLCAGDCALRSEFTERILTVLRENVGALIARSNEAYFHISETVYV